MANIFSIPGPNSKYKIEGAKPAGFLGGLWHGYIAVITFVVSLFNPKVMMWEINNNGRLYELGFLIGIGAFSSQPFIQFHERK